MQLVPAPDRRDHRRAVERPRLELGIVLRPRHLHIGVGPTPGGGGIVLDSIQADHPDRIFNTLLTGTSSAAADHKGPQASGLSRREGRGSMTRQSSVAPAVLAFDEAGAARAAKGGILGLGYAGLPLAVGFAGSGV